MNLLNTSYNCPNKDWKLFYICENVLNTVIAFLANYSEYFNYYFCNWCVNLDMMFVSSLLNNE